MSTPGQETTTACDASTSVMCEPARRSINRSAAGGRFLPAVAVNAKDGIVLVLVRDGRGDVDEGLHTAGAGPAGVVTAPGPVPS
ncbi:hypothetical protein [Streptomyces candidus]|uniref:Uncharacterized protein n=1 Tax=Streptomyces candidus TaxID=67283 RepID=A0A7X0HJL1_9ACTN|nr:hypothetical protein [Streptomyces candidus]MBB6438864.1 hypothetical protein [Streptomyces candidus]